MSKKILAMILAIIMVLGTMPVLALLSNADELDLYGDGYEGVAYDVQTLEMTDIILLFTYGCDAQTDMSQNPGNYTWVIGIDGVDYTAQPSSFYSDWLVRFKPIQWSTPYVPEWGSTVEFTLTVYSGDTTVLDAGTSVEITFPDQPARAGDIAPTAVADGSSVTYAYDSLTNTLTFDGTGTVPSYSDIADRPWNSIKDSIVKVVVKGGVTAIGDRACNSFPNLDEIVMEEGVTSTGFDCFAHCGTITSVYLPTTLTSMSQGGFYGSSIVDVYYDDTSRDFGDRCTMGAYNDAITNANWVNDPEWGSFGDLSATVAWAFNSSTGTLSITGTGAIPSPATKPWQSFVNQITKVVIGEGLTEIPGGGLFAHLNNLDRIEMPDTITKIGGDAFAYNGTVSYMRLSSNVTSISQGVLYSTTVTTISCTKDWRAIQQQSSVGNYNTSFGTATWVDCTIFGTYFSFGKYGSGMENWTGNGDPRLTQILIATPKWDGTYISDLNDDEWTLTFEAVDGSETAVTTTLYPRSVYDGGTWCILRFVPALSSDPAGRFSPTPNKDYYVTATITYNGVTETVTSGDTFKFVKDDGGEDPITFANYYTITWQIDGVTEYTEQIPEGFKPVYHGAAATYTDPQTGVRYDVSVPTTVAATANATYNVTYVPHIPLSFGKYGSGMENWTGNGDPRLTQILIATPNWEGTYQPDLNSLAWTLTFAPADPQDSEPAVTTTLTARSLYNGGDWAILRFVPALSSTAAGRFSPTPNKEYYVTGTVTYEGVTCSYTCPDTFVFVKDETDPDAEDPITFTYYTITWQVDGVTEYTEEVPEGFTPEYAGAAASYTQGTIAYVLTMPDIAPATADATYNLTYTATDMTVGRLYLWGDGYENWGGDNNTQFLLRTADWEGNELTAINGHTAEYDWILTINGTTYNVKPSSNYGATIWRFEPVLWSTPLIPQAGASYSIGLEIYDANQVLVFQSAENTTITIADDFLPTHAHTFATSWVWEDDFSAATLTLYCADCNGSVTVAADTVVDNGNNSYTATVTYDGVEYSDTAYGNPAGDINGDMSLDVTDVTALLDYLGNGTTTGILVSMVDVDGSGEVNVSDVTALLDALANA